MRFEIRFSANRDQASGGGPSEDALFDLFSGGSAKHFEPIDDDEDDALPHAEPPQAVESDESSSTDDRQLSSEPESPRHREPAATSRQHSASRGRTPRRQPKTDEGVPTPTPPQKSGSKVSHWDNLAASLGLEVESTQHDRISEDVETPAEDTSELAPSLSAAADTGEDSWKQSVADLFQMDPAEIPSRAEVRDDLPEDDSGEEPEDSDDTFVSDLDADFVEFEVRDLAPNQERVPEVERPRRGASPRAESAPAGRRDARRERRPDRGSERGRDQSSRPPRRESAAPRNRPAEGASSEPSESRRESRPPRNKPESRSAKSSAPASADLLHDDDDFVETSGDDQTKRVTSWAEAIDVMIERNLSTRRKPGPSSSGGRRPRSSDRNNDRRR